MLMIITCPFCNKNFDVNTNLIPDKGRLLKCGFVKHGFLIKMKIKNP